MTPMNRSSRGSISRPRSSRCLAFAQVEQEARDAGVMAWPLVAVGQRRPTRLTFIGCVPVVGRGDRAGMGAEADQPRLRRRTVSLRQLADVQLVAQHAHVGEGGVADMAVVRPDDRLGVAAPWRRGACSACRTCACRAGSSSPPSRGTSPGNRPRRPCTRRAFWRGVEPFVAIRSREAVDLLLQQVAAASGRPPTSQRA